MRSTARTEPALSKPGKSYLGAESRFCGFLAEHYRLQNIKNVEGRHLRAYVEQLQDEGKSAAYIDATLSGIRFYHRRSGSKNRLPENKDLHLEKRHPGKLNRAWLTSEIVKACEIAHEMGDQDVMMAILLGANFGLRVSEIVTVRINQLENALNHRQFHVPRGKGGQKRDIPVDTKNQVMLLKQLLNYAKKRARTRRLFAVRYHEHSVLKEKNRLIRWMNNHRKKFIDPDRASRVKPGKKPRATERLGFHSLRHYYEQQYESRLRAEGKLTDEEIRREVSESMGHHRPSVTKLYTE